MASHEYNGTEYAPSANRTLEDGSVVTAAWVTRPAGSTADWTDCPDADVPMDVRVDERIIQDRHKNGAPPMGSIVRLANPVLDPIAFELGLTRDQLRLRTNDTSSTGTVNRVTDARFGEIAAAIGMSSGELADRFAGRHPDLRDPSTPGAV